MHFCSQTSSLPLRHLLQLNSKNLTRFGPLDDHAGSDDETTYNAITLPGAKRSDDGSRSSRVEVLTLQVSFSSTGREWAAVSGEGLHVYSLDDDMMFDPIFLTEAITPAAVESKLDAKRPQYGVALSMAVHLNEYALVKQVMDSTPYASISHIVRGLGPTQLERVMQFLTKVLEEGSPHIEFYMQWCLQLLQTHGVFLERRRGSFMRAFRAMHKVIQTRHDELKTICNENKYTLDFVEDQARLILKKRKQQETVTN